jgi:hypothetical protein
MLTAVLADHPSALDTPEALSRGGLSGAAPSLPAGLGFHFIPMLDVTHGVINTYHCEAWCRTDGGELRHDYDVLPPEENDVLTGELDCRRLEATLAGLRRMRARGEVAMIATSVHCRSIETTVARRALMALLETIQPEEKRFLAIVVCGLPDGAPTARLGYVVSFLQRFCRAVTVMRSLKTPHADRLEGSGAFGMNVTVGSAPSGAPAAIAALGELIKAAKKYHLRALAAGLSSPMLVAYAMLSGFNHVSGDGLLPPQADPEGIRRFACDEFLAQLGSQKALEAVA